MTNNIIAVISFIVSVIAMCKIWNAYVMRKYYKTKKNK